MTTPHPKRRPRRFLQFSLRALLVFVLLVSIGMSWLAAKMEKARRQKEAVEAIEEGGMIIYEDGYWYGDPFADTSFPKWLLRLFGRDFLSDVVHVSAARHFGDKEASHLKALTNLIRLYLCDTQVTDAGLEHLEGLTSLDHLDLSSTQVTDAGLKHLEGLTNLTLLYLTDTQVTPEGVKKLQEALPECEIVYED